MSYCSTLYLCLLYSC